MRSLLPSRRETRAEAELRQWAGEVGNGIIKHASLRVRQSEETRLICSNLIRVTGQVAVRKER